MLIHYTRRFLKDAEKAPEKIRRNFYERLKIFENDKFYSQLNNHALCGKYSGSRSINITGNWRAVFKEKNNGKEILFIGLGTHSQLYKK
ncbi:MAG: type II toxin-antitoxin system mRNA interferase toxin, RelE/StbE family [Patescibacteria group bacterium]|jgi:addiction module RelE/StbE family toxin